MGEDDVDRNVVHMLEYYWFNLIRLWHICVVVSGVGECVGVLVYEIGMWGRNNNIR